MKIVLANKFYYRRGGDCIYTINLEDCLVKQGHEVAIFAMHHPESLKSRWSEYFPSEITFKPGLKMVEAVMRPFGTREVKSKFNRLLTDFKPDVVHLGNIHSQLSPVVAQIAHQHGIRVVWTMHDYKLLCPRYDCLRNGKQPCEECFTDKSQVMVNRCMKQSVVASYIAYREAMKWSLLKLEQYTDRFICPSQFMADKLIKGGMTADKISVLCNFINIDNLKADATRKNYYCYVGRLSPEKGLKSLVEAALQLPYRLKIVGEGPLHNELQAMIKDADHIELMGYKSWHEIKDIVAEARFMVLPSEWYENNPYSAIEALSMGTPVLGSRIGGIPELIETGMNGELYEPMNMSALKEKIDYMFTADYNYYDIANAAQQKFNAFNYYQKLMPIYKGKE